MVTRSLVTGGAGFLGSHVAEHCLKLGHEVYVLDDVSGGYSKNVPLGATFVQGSVTDNVLIDELFARVRFDYVYHLAAYAAEGLSHFIRRFNYTNNLLGSVNLINASVRHDIKCLVFTSSIAVYGSNNLPMIERQVPHPEDPYGISKYAVELDLRAAYAQFGLNYVIFRPHNVYGERQNIGDGYRNVIGIFMNQLMTGRKMTIFGDGLQTRAFSYVGDVAPWIALSAERPDLYNEIFNIGADEPCTVVDLARIVAQALNREAQIEFLAPRLEAQHAWSDHRKLRRALGEMPPSTPLRIGVDRMAKWAVSEGACTTSVFTNIEVCKNMPASWLKVIQQP
jgi:UDP-glucose 4-epimerase